MATVSLSRQEHLRYWRGLIRQEQCPDPRLYPGIVEELRAALRDAVQILDSPSQRDAAESSPRWRENWQGRC